MLHKKVYGCIDGMTNLNDLIPNKPWLFSPLGFPWISLYSSSSSLIYSVWPGWQWVWCWWACAGWQCRRWRAKPLHPHSQLHYFLQLLNGQKREIRFILVVSSEPSDYDRNINLVQLKQTWDILCFSVLSLCSFPPVQSPAKQGILKNLMQNLSFV